jgi:hypothetical protein
MKIIMKIITVKKPQMANMKIISASVRLAKVEARAGHKGRFCHIG